MEDDEVQRNFLRDMLERGKKGEKPLMIPLQYADAFGVPMQVAEANLEHMADRGWIQAEMKPTTSGKFIFVRSITPTGIDHLNGQKTVPSPIKQTSHNFQGVKDSLIAMGSHSVPTQGPDISFQTFEELYSYLDKNLSGEQAYELKKLLNKLQGEILYGTVKTSTLKKIAALATEYGPPVVTTLDFIARQLGLKA
jgi:hypothetical protein